ncbi:GTP cyclohydrolase II [Caulobacter sp. BP25]|uniref:GTP cyclohydrolase II n=1 Tax=Caulobacter sp. BP25 TaxID=2048900 RepID=UPI000C12B644|nr:GTP cyclohydrolase II [Caulobacter sp. BP25]PHY21113.1 GTP cyclohydrolase II [Caulobacter sp. BP25]
MIKDQYGLDRLCEASIPTDEGKYSMAVYLEKKTGREHVAMVMGNVVTAPPLVRIHSECMTGDLFGSLRCDCGDQLAAARARIGMQGAGIILYLRQEGRGIGLANKLRAYALQDRGLDTVEANLELGFAADLRSFDIAAEMLADLGVAAVRLMTNNPRKLEALEAAGIRVVERVPMRSVARPENQGYLSTKATKLGHAIDWLDGAVTVSRAKSHRVNT